VAIVMLACTVAMVVVAWRYQRLADDVIGDAERTVIRADLDQDRDK
jgi:hypothetical protein